MKNFILLCLFCSCFIAFAQAPQRINYQSIALNSGGSPIINTNIGIKISILESTSTGSVLYSESHTKTTNAQGMYALVIGDGTILSGTFAFINWGTNNKWLKVEVDPAGGTSYTASGTSQFLSVPYALYANTAATVSPANSIKPVNNIAALRLYSGVDNGDIVYVKDYAGNNDGGGGHFVWNNTASAVDNGGTIITPNSVPTGRWLRKIEGTAINVKWFGILGEGLDYSVQLTKLINFFAPGSATAGNGVKVYFPKGVYKLKDIKIPYGISLAAEQSSRHNVNFWNSPAIIQPATGAINIFKFEDPSSNASLENLNIDGQNMTSLVAAIFLRGNFNSLLGNNIVNCYRHAVYSTAGQCRIENNNFQGMTGPFTGSGFLGALHIIGMGDSYIINNEIGAGSTYSTLKDASFRRVVAFYGESFNNNFISGNLFENGDRGAYIINCGYSFYSGNRYEYNAGGGLEIKNFFQCTFSGERFANNSLAGDGTYSDLVINADCGTSTFISPIFTAIWNPALSSALNIRRPGYNIVNHHDDTGVWKNKFITPFFSHQHWSSQSAFTMDGGSTNYNVATGTSINNLSGTPLALYMIN